MRRAGLAVIVLSFVGCFAPKVKNRGFACDGNYPGACPSGFSCINGICDDGSGGPPPPVPDMSMPGTGGNGGSGGGDGGGGGTGGGMDMATVVHDFAMPPPPPDFAQPPPPDMASSCAHPICQTGSRLIKTCDPCVTQVCSVDPTCCSTAGQWDSICVGEVTSVCGQSCP